ncbi:MAG TPA: class I SAM-dependent methyltransferase [Nitrolancea sp.]|nr:class I SAM-dependent methyltransferase [Nitrolancea sp.]
MDDDVEFRSDLFHGTAADYDTFRIDYPKALVDDLVRRSKVTGQGVCLDLACGTGQMAFALAPGFREVWAVDQEPDMIALVCDKATRAGATHVHSVASAAEALDAPLAAFELVTVGNAFHRLRRDTVARSIFAWLKPGGHVALVWGDSPWVGDSGWQTALVENLDRWKATSAGRVPLGWEEPRRQRPDRLVLTEVGLEFLGTFGFSEEYRWTVEELIGFVYSTSFLSRHALGACASEFESDMHSSLDRFDSSVGLHQTINFAYEFYVRP